MSAIVSLVAVSVCVLFPTPVVWLPIGSAALVFAVMLSRNPRYWYRRTAACILGAWTGANVLGQISAALVIRLPEGELREQLLSGALQLDNQPLAVHAVVVIVVVVLLALDAWTNTRAIDALKDAVAKESAESTEPSFLSLERRVSANDAAMLLLQKYQADTRYFSPDTRKLTNKQQFQLTLNQLKAEERKFYAKLVVPVLFVVIVLFFADRVLASRIAVSVDVYFTAGPEDSAVVDSGEIFYRHPTFGQRQAEIVSGQATLRDVPYDAREIRVNRVTSPQFITLEQKRRRPAPWVYEIVNGDVDIPMVSIVLQNPTLPSSEELQQFVLKEGLAADVANGAAVAVPDDFLLRVFNHAGAEVDVLIFNCRHLEKLTGDIEVIEEAADHVTISEGGDETVYPKWIVLERVRDIPVTEHDASIRTVRRCGRLRFEQFYKPTGYFIVAVRYRDPRNNVQRQELLGVYNLFQSPGPKFEIQADATKRGGRHQGLLAP
ncbi:MAG: hypothetical protein AB7O68_14595 [Pirellulales bacterium]